MSLCFAIAWAADSQYLVSFRQIDEKMVDKKIYSIKQQFVSSFFPSLFLLGQTDVSPTRCWGENLLLLLTHALISKQ